MRDFNVLTSKSKTLLEHIITETKNILKNHNSLVKSYDLTKPNRSVWDENTQKIFETKNEYIKSLKDLFLHEFLIKINEEKDGMLEPVFTYYLCGDIIQNIQDWWKQEQNKNDQELKDEDYG